MEEEVVLIELRAILLSAPHGLTSREVHRDFLSFVGTHLPFKKFGFTTLEAYLYSKPAIVRRGVENGQTIYRAVADDSTRHIADMVSKQRTKKPKSRMSSSWSSTSGFHSSKPTAGRAAVTGERSSRSSDCTFGLRSLPNGFPRAEHKKAVPHETQRQVAILLSQHSTGIYCDNFLRMYRDLNKAELSPKHLGFYDVHELLRSMPEVARLEHSKSGTGYLIFPSLSKDASNFYRPKQTSAESSFNDVSCSVTAALAASRQHAAIGADLKAETRKILQCRPNGLWAGRFLLEYEDRFGRQCPYESLGYSSVTELLAMVPDVCSVRRPTPTSDFMVFPAERHTATSSSAAAPAAAVAVASSVDACVSDCPPLEEDVPGSGRRLLQSHTPSYQQHHQHRHEQQVDATYDQDHHMFQSRRSSSSCDRLIDEVTLSRLLQLVQAHMPNGLHSSLAMDLYRERFGQPLKLRELGFHTVEEMFGIMNSYVSVQSHRDHGCIVKLNASSRYSGVTPRTFAETSAMGLSASPGSISPSSSSLALRQQVANAGIDPIQTAMSNFGIGKSPESGSTFDNSNSSSSSGRLRGGQAVHRAEHSTLRPAAAAAAAALSAFPASERHHGNREPLTYRSQTSQPSPSAWRNSPQYLQQEHRQQHQFPRQPLQGSSPRKQCEVVITHINSPSDFFIQVVGKATTGKLELLSKEIDSLFQDRAGTNHALSAPELGCVCAALYEDGVWYRATVLAKLSAGTYMVDYLDYGNQGKVSSACLRSLRKEMLELPPQAIRCCLHGVAPDRSGSWPSTSCKLFQDYQYVPVQATFHSNEDAKTAITLFKTASEETVNALISKTVLPLKSPSSGPAAYTHSPSAHISSKLTGIPSNVPRIGSRAGNGEAVRCVSDSSLHQSSDFLNNSTSGESTLPFMQGDDSPPPLEDDLPPPLEPLEGDGDDSGVFEHRSGLSSSSIPTTSPSSSEHVVYDSAAEDSLEMLEEKIELLSTWLECSEKGREELCCNMSVADTDRLDSMLRAAHSRLDRLKRLALGKRQINRHLPPPSLVCRPRCG